MIPFVNQKKFFNCKNIKELPFDFYLPNHNICIEFNGLQHYKSIRQWGGEKGLKRRKKHDKIKKEYCKKNEINLVVIKYNQDIEKIINKI